MRMTRRAAVADYLAAAAPLLAGALGPPMGRITVTVDAGFRAVA